MLPFLLLLVPVRRWFRWIVAAFVGLTSISVNKYHTSTSNTTTNKISYPEEQVQQNALLFSGHDRPRVKIDVYIESLCIDSKKFILDVLVPTYELLGPSIMDLSVISFGNAKYSGNETKKQSKQLICQHGVAECDANAYILCVADIYKHMIDRYLPFIVCLFESLPMGYSATPYESKYFASCSHHTAIDWTDNVKVCHKDHKRVRELQYSAYQQTLVTNHTYVPWIHINGKYWNETESTVQSFRDVICSMYMSNSKNDSAGNTTAPYGCTAVY